MMARVPLDPPPVALWNAEDYAQKCATTHREFDDWFLRRHGVRSGDDIVDLGCGTGEFTAHLARLAAPGRVTGIDVDPSMIGVARRLEGGNLSFLHGSAEDADALVPPASVNLVVSRAVLHWLPASSLPKVFAAAFAILRPGGWFHAECGGMGQAPALMSVLTALADEHGLPQWPGFPDTGLTFEHLEQAGFVVPDEGVRTVVQRRPFSREGALGYLTTGSINSLTRHIPDEAGRQALIRAAATRLEQLRRYDGTFDATFVRLELLAQRPA
jgi:SAM-dependent methyltransferase